MKENYPFLLVPCLLILSNSAYPTKELFPAMEPILEVVPIPAMIMVPAPAWNRLQLRLFESSSDSDSGIGNYRNHNSSSLAGLYQLITVQPLGQDPSFDKWMHGGTIQHHVHTHIYLPHPFHILPLFHFFAIFKTKGPVLQRSRAPEHVRATRIKSTTDLCEAHENNRHCACHCYVKE